MPIYRNCVQVALLREKCKQSEGRPPQSVKASEGTQDRAKQLEEERDALLVHPSIPCLMIEKLRV